MHHERTGFRPSAVPTARTARGLPMRSATQAYGRASPTGSPAPPPAAGAGGGAGDPVRGGPPVRLGGGAHRQSARGPGGGNGARPEPGPADRAVPSRLARRRRARRLPVRRAVEAAALRARAQHARARGLGGHAKSGAGWAVSTAAGRGPRTAWSSPRSRTPARWATGRRPRASPRGPDRAPSQARLARLDWDGVERDLWDSGRSRGCPGSQRRGVRGADGALRGRRALPLPHRHGALPVRVASTSIRRAAAAARGTLRRELYRRLAPIANQWVERSGRVGALSHRSRPSSSPACEAQGQRRPTPLVLRYDRRWLQLPPPGSVRRARLPAAIHVRAEPVGEDFTGGESLLVEQRPRAQSQGEVVVLQRGGGGDLSQPPPADRRFARPVPRDGASRRQPPPSRASG